jgi:hypothetical protein
MLPGKRPLQPSQQASNPFLNATYERVSKSKGSCLSLSNLLSLKEEESSEAVQMGNTRFVQKSSEKVKNSIAVNDLTSNLLGLSKKGALRKL